MQNNLRLLSIGFFEEGRKKEREREREEKRERERERGGGEIDS